LAATVRVALPFCMLSILAMPWALLTAFLLVLLLLCPFNPFAFLHLLLRLLEAFLFDFWFFNIAHFFQVFHL
jgi:hypothetical protein